MFTFIYWVCKKGWGRGGVHSMSQCTCGNHREPMEVTLYPWKSHCTHDSHSVTLEVTVYLLQSWCTCVSHLYLWQSKCTHGSHSVPVEVRRWLVGVGFLLHPWVSGMELKLSGGKCLYLMSHLTSPKSL